MNGSFSLRIGVLVGGFVVGCALTPVLPRVLRGLGLERTNYQGQPIGAGAGLLLVVSVFPWLFLGSASDLRLTAAVLGYGALGFIDDRWGTAEFKGLRGHLRALRQGRVTTGFLKAAGGAALALLLAFSLQLSWWSAISALLIALSANLLNLLDLRPLRTLKGFWLLSAGLLGAGPPLLAQLWGLSLPYARLEARRRVMLGDTGANALGGALGVSAALLLPYWAQALAVTLLLGFHVWAEKHSLSRWIEARSWARRIDGWGWSTD